MKKIDTQSVNCAVSALLLVTALASVLVTHSARAQDVVLDSIRAVVNEDVVLDSDVNAAVTLFKLQAQSNNQSTPPDNIIQERILEQLIVQEVHRQHARSIGLSVNPASINRALEQIARNNNMDTSQFRQTLVQQGFDYDYFRQTIEQELLLQRLVEREVQTRIRNSSTEIDDFVEAARNNVEEQQRYRILHILIAVPANATEEQLDAANQRAKAVRVRLEAGGDFAIVAAASSDGSRALQGGDLGWRTLQELPEFIRTPVREMQIGDTSDILLSANGLHIIQLAEKQNTDASQQAETLARHIFIAGNSADVESQLLQVRQRLRSGESFATLAASISEDPNSASNGGELPWFSQGQLPPAMEQTANALKLKEISQPFRTQFGWHLLEVLDRRVRDVDEETLRRQADNALRQRKVEQETQRWSRQLRDESYVEIRG